MSYVGDFALAATVRYMWNSNAVAGESITRATNGTVQVYKDGSSTSEVTTGVTDTEDFDGKTGVHLTAIDLSSDGTFYSSGADFQVVLVGSTIDGKAINAFLFSFSINNRAGLRPTTAGRTLDVSAGGEAGVDWANVGSPTTTVGLSGTTVKTATDVQADTDDIQARLPAALVSGRIDASVGAMAANVLTATAINADAITAAKVADGTIDALTFAAGAINAAAIATDAITAAKIAADAIGASELAADAVTEIQAGLATSAALVTAQADLDDIQTRLPAALVSGRMDSSVGAAAANTITASALATDAVTEIQTAVAAGSVASVAGAVGSVTGNVGGSVGSVAAGGITATSLAADALTAAKVAADVGAEIAAAVRTELTTELARIDTTVSSRLPTSGYTAPPWETTIAEAVLDDTIGDGSITVRQALRVILAGMAGKLSGAAGTTITIRNLADSQDVVLATVDSVGNRSAVTVTP